MSGLRRPIRRYSLARIRHYVREAFEPSELDRKLVTLEENIDQALQSVQADRDTPRPDNIVRGVIYDPSSISVAAASELALTAPELIDGNGMVLSGSRLVNASGRTIRAKVSFSLNHTGGLGSTEWHITKNGDAITGAKLAVVSNSNSRGAFFEAPGLVELAQGDYLAASVSVAGTSPTASEIKLSAMEVGN